jgi:DNA-binding transcriptional ArsR family regulator
VPRVSYRPRLAKLFLVPDAGLAPGWTALLQVPARRRPLPYGAFARVDRPWGILVRVQRRRSAEAQELADVFAALADPARIRLLRYLLDDDHCVTQCTEHLGLSQGAVSKHLARLESAGLLVRRRVGRRTYQRVGDPSRVAAMLSQAAMLRHTGGPPDDGPPRSAGDVPGTRPPPIRGNDRRPGRRDLCST